MTFCVLWNICPPQGPNDLLFCLLEDSVLPFVWLCNPSQCFCLWCEEEADGHPPHVFILLFRHHLLKAFFCPSDDKSPGCVSLGLFLGVALNLSPQHPVISRWLKVQYKQVPFVLHIFYFFKIKLFWLFALVLESACKSLPSKKSAEILTRIALNLLINLGIFKLPQHYHRRCFNNRKSVPHSSRSQKSDLVASLFLACGRQEAASRGLRGLPSVCAWTETPAY